MSTYIQIAILAIIQGLAELLPVSSSAHVIVAEKLMGMDPAAAENTLLIVLLHTGTMFAVIVYYWRAWMKAYFSSWQALKATAIQVFVACALSGAVFLVVRQIIKMVYAKGNPNFEIEHLFGDLNMVAGALGAAGILIIGSSFVPELREPMTLGKASIMGAVQGLCLPFRGFSRSGATISAGLFAGVSKQVAEEFSFALGVAITPIAIGVEYLRFAKAKAALPAEQAAHLGSFLLPSLIGLVIAFLTGLLALRWLSSWLGSGRWHFFGIYCLVASVALFIWSP